MIEERESSKCIGIAGLGLIGGSLGLDLQRLGYRVHGYAHKVKTAERAKERKLANEISTDAKILSDCEIVILALPIDILLNPEKNFIKSIASTSVVTDVGSVKVPILKVWEKLHPLFIGSHPMAGTEKFGVESGVNNLFFEKPWIITPTIKTDINAKKEVEKIAKKLGCKLISAEAGIHDEAVSLISHLPVLISATLLRTLKSQQSKSILSLAKIIASSGFADTTRVGGGNPKLNSSMIENNKNAILKSLSSYRWSLEQFEETILSQNWSELERQFEKTNLFRPEFIKEDL